MSAPHPVPFLRRLLSTRRPPRTVDPADYGTAFGLDMSLEPNEVPSASDGAEGTVASAASDDAWFKRWRRG